MKFISPGGWFSLEYPATWCESEDTEESFLFYNPNKWNGNFRISAYRGASSDYARQCIAYELENTPTSVMVKIGEWECAYSTETFQEDKAWYTSHIWVTGKGDMSFECSFTVAKGNERTPAEELIRSLKIRTGKEQREVIPIRILEIGEVNAAYEWVSTTVKNSMNKDFSSQEADIVKLQALVEGGKIRPEQRVVWENIGLVLGVIMENEMDGLTWVSVIDGKKEYAALQFGDFLMNPADLVWNKIRGKRPLDLQAEYAWVKSEVEKRL